MAEHDENLINDIMRGGPNYCLDRIEALEAEVSRLRLAVAWQNETIAVLDARIVDLEADVLKKHVMAGKLADESAHQKRRIFELEAALEPIAEAANKADSLMRHTPDSAKYYVEVGDLRKARATLAPKEGEDG